MKLIILGCLIASAVAVPALYNVQPSYQQQFIQPQHPVYENKPVVPIVSQSNVLNQDGSFIYSYVSGDGSQAQAQGYVINNGPGEDDDSQSQQGSYSYVAPDGTPIKVNWIADANGFRAEGAHIPRTIPLQVQAQSQYTNQYRPNAYQSQNTYQNQGIYGF